jgi:hypothetical protein
VDLPQDQLLLSLQVESWMHKELSIEHMVIDFQVASLSFELELWIFAQQSVLEQYSIEETASSLVQLYVAVELLVLRCLSLSALLSFAESLLQQAIQLRQAILSLLAKLCDSQQQSLLDDS